QVIARPRAIFDFTNREGVIAFDFDGMGGGRETWYVDVFPSESPNDIVDITAHVSFDPGPGVPGRFLRFSQSGDSVIIHHHDKHGTRVPATPEKVDFVYEHPKSHLTPGVMRHWELHVAQDHAWISIDGQKVHEVDNLGLDFSRGYVEWAQFGY